MGTTAASKLKLILSNNMAGRNTSDISAVSTIIPVVSHYKYMTFRDNDFLHLIILCRFLNIRLIQNLTVFYNFIIFKLIVTLDVANV